MYKTCQFDSSAAGVGLCITELDYLLAQFGKYILRKQLVLIFLIHVFPCCGI